MASYAVFTATTTNLFIQNVKTMAEANGWIIDFFGLYSSNNRLHLHNSEGSHFEIWYNSAVLVNIAACTGYDSALAPTSQPGVSGVGQIVGNLVTLVFVAPFSISLKTTNTSQYRNMQFGTIVDKIGSWTGGTFFGTTTGQYPGTASYNNSFWETSNSTVWQAQVLINGVWSTLASNSAGGCVGICQSELYTRMPFAYSGGIIPCPILLVQKDVTTSTYLHPLGYAPDLRYFAGGNVYASMEEIVIDGDTWVAMSASELNGGVVAVPNILIRLAA